ncbi:hypothetical protein HNR60_000645 [Rhodopseudomonas rhenobacensis]|uniref:Uncharacterized protein n=1 Tax=Rhodopseudomonas rhenobacensis TaxID=87461 RepID=A0A7W7Z0S9_9BRAD|nr:hypothetical protein [Rhodopseudomonas rhenobacensis]MBB5045910.1 hypothetical protein [Rhodopseudomonas rhenobacensis]
MQMSLLSCDRSAGAPAPARRRSWRGGLAALLGLGLAGGPAPSLARDLGQWEGSDPQLREWYRSLMQPDFPTVSCCGEADAYWADSYEIQDGQYVAIITDPRPDAPLRRPHLEIGTRILVPNHKLKWDGGNPTGHGIIFLGGPGFVFCYLPPGGV